MLKESDFFDPQVHNSAGINQVIVDWLYETSMGLRSFIGILHPLLLAIDCGPLSTIWPRYSIGRIESSVKPLRTVRSRDLIRETIVDFVVEGSGLIAREKAHLLAPVGPATGESTEDLSVTAFAGVVFDFRFPEILLRQDVGCIL